MARLTATGFNQGDLYNYLTNLRTRPLGNPTLAVESNYDVQNSTAYDYAIDGVLYTDASGGSCDTGTSVHCAIAYWNVMLVSVDTSAALTGTWPSGTTGYVTEAEAIANLPDVPSGECAIGYVTIQANAADTFLAGTDGLNDGSGGNKAQGTNYYNLSDVNNLSLI